jgi:hypothetical protein
MVRKKKQVLLEKTRHGLRLKADIKYPISALNAKYTDFVILHRSVRRI